MTAALNARRAVRRAALMISHTDWTSNIREPPLFLLLLLPRQEKVLRQMSIDAVALLWSLDLSSRAVHTGEEERC